MGEESRILKRFDGGREEAISLSKRRAVKARDIKASMWRRGLIKFINNYAKTLDQKFRLVTGRPQGLAKDRGGNDKKGVCGYSRFKFCLAKRCGGFFQEIRRGRILAAEVDVRTRNPSVICKQTLTRTAALIYRKQRGRVKAGGLEEWMKSFEFVTRYYSAFSFAQSTQAGNEIRIIQKDIIPTYSITESGLKQHKTSRTRAGSGGIGCAALRWSLWI